MTDLTKAISQSLNTYAILKYHTNGMYGGAIMRLFNILQIHLPPQNSKQGWPQSTMLRPGNSPWKHRYYESVSTSYKLPPEYFFLYTKHCRQKRLTENVHVVIRRNVAAIRRGIGNESIPMEKFAWKTWSDWDLPQRNWSIQTTEHKRFLAFMWSATLYDFALPAVSLTKMQIGLLRVLKKASHSEISEPTTRMSKPWFAIERSYVF